MLLARNSLFQEVWAKYPNIPQVQKLLDEGAKIDQEDDFGRTPLWIAIARATEPGFEQLALLFIERNANVNAIPQHRESSFSPLFAAASKGLINLVDPLLKHGAKVDARVKKTLLTPLYSAAQSGHTAVVSKLLDSSAQIDAVSYVNETALLASVDAKKIGPVIVLVRRGCNPNIANDEGLTPLISIAGSKPPLQQIDFLMAKTILCDSVKKVDLEYFSKKYGTPLIAACNSSHDSLVSILLEKGANPNTSCELIDPNNKLQITSPLLQASYIGQATIVERLLGVGADPNFCNNEGGSPLYMACQNGFMDCVRHLLPVVKDPNQSIFELNRTPLHIASSQGYDQIVKLLLTNPSTKIDALDFAQMTSLHLAAAHGHLLTIKALHEGGSQLNSQAEDGATPVLFAAQEGYLLAVDYLLKAGADPLLPRRDGQTPLSLAGQYGHVETVKLLCEYSFKDMAEDKYILTQMCIMLALLHKGDMKEFKKAWDHFWKHLIPDMPENNTPKPVSGFISEEPSVVPQSARRFLESQGFAREEIRKMLKGESSPEIAQPKKSGLSDTPKDLPVCWLGGLFSSTMPYVRKIESASNSNCYFYVDVENLRKQGCENTDVFESLRPRFCAKNGEQGIKTLTGPYPKIKVIWDQQVIVCEIQYELKSLSTGERILCFALPANANKTLIIGAFYAKKHDQLPLSYWEGKTIHFSSKT